MADLRNQGDIMRNINFPELVAFGENPLGFTAQTANGTAHAKGSGWNRQRNFDMPQAPATDVWGQAEIDIAGSPPVWGRMANRTGE